PFERIVHLPEDADLTRAEARYERGLLRIQVPVAVRERAPQPVPIEIRGTGDALSGVGLELPETPDVDDVEIPRTLPVLPLKETVVFPDSATPLAIGQERSIQLIDDVVARDGKLALVAVKNPDVEQPGWDDLYDVGTAAIVHKLIKVPDGTLRH